VVVAVGCVVAFLLAITAGCSDEKTPIAQATVPTEEAGTGSSDSAAADTGTDASAASNGNSGDACNVDADCKGLEPVCVRERRGIVYPGGQCTSKCDPQKNEPSTGRNPDCPGTKSMCNKRRGLCLQSCTAKTGASPCRQGYACFEDEGPVCAPEALSQCNPSVPGSCAPLDGGARGCISVGLDLVGFCVEGCNVFTQGCSQAGFGCFPNAIGEGICLTATATGTSGVSCEYINACAPGFGCPTSGVCRPFCGGPANVACTNGKTCIDYSVEVKKSVVGLCDG
jgi:hypothetical protein